MAAKQGKQKTDIVVKIENAYKAYGQNRVLGNLNLEIRREKFTCIVGPSGCGKSVLVYLIAGYEGLDQIGRAHV